MERPFFIIVGQGEETPLLAPLLEQRHMAKAPSWFAVHAYREFPAPAGQGWTEKLAELLDGRRRVGIEPSLPFAQSRLIRGGEVEAQGLIETMRLVKSPFEIQMLRRSAPFAGKAVEALLKASGYGKSIIEGYMAKSAIMGQIVTSVPHWEPQTTEVTMAVWAAPRSADPHSIPAPQDVMREGPHVALALCRVNGYATECERTFFVSPPTGTERELYRLMMEARLIGFSMVRPGARAAEIDEAVNRFLVGEGHGPHLLHRTGHGFGLGVHEGPWLAEGSDDVLREGMLISMEPGIYLPDLGGYRHSDTVLVTSDGYEILTPLPTALDELVLAA